MKYLGPKNPFYVILVVFVTIGLFYVVMFVADISLDDAREMGWFWSHDELVYKSNDTPVSSSVYILTLNILVSTLLWFKKDWLYGMGSTCAVWSAKSIV